MLIRDWVTRLYGDVAHDWAFCTVMIAIVLLVCWLSAEGVIAVGRKTEAWIKRRSWNRPARRAARGPQVPLAAPEPADPLADAIEDLIAGAEQDCRDAAQRRDA
jgi:hypothetical protein